VTETTVVHLVRHGEVDNPTGVLYGRIPDFHLSDLGRKMADRVAEYVTGRDIVELVTSPLERAQETMDPIAAVFGITPRIDERVIEAANLFEGKRFGVGDGALRKPSSWWLLRNPFKPSWGEPYQQIVRRMRDAMETARERAAGHEALIVSHQLPIWIVRSAIEDRRLWHDPRKRQCSLASLTSFTFHGDAIVSIGYAEPAKDLLPVKPRKKFTAGA
jgi:broad specificity phosphatase PhoE